MVKILKLFNLITCLIKTEIISGVELIILFKFRDFFISLMNLENDVFGIKYGIAFALIIIPLISALHDYQKNKRQIASILREIWK